MQQCTWAKDGATCRSRKKEVVDKDISGLSGAKKETLDGDNRKVEVGGNKEVEVGDNLKKAAGGNKVVEAGAIWDSTIPTTRIIGGTT